MSSADANTYAGFPRVFRDQTDLPVYRIGVDGYWTHNGFWGNEACPLSPTGEALAVRALDLEGLKSYVFVLDLKGRVMAKWEDPNQDVTNRARVTTGASSVYHGGDVFWSRDGTVVYGEGFRYGWEVSTGRPIDGPRDPWPYGWDFSTGRLPHPQANPPPLVVCGTQTRNIDRGDTDAVPPEERYGLFVADPEVILREVQRAQQQEGHSRNDRALLEECELTISVTELRERRARLHPDWAPLPDTPIDALAVKWNESRDYFQFNLGNHVVGYKGYRPPLVREVWVCSRDFEDVRPVIPYLGDEPQTFRNHSSFRYPGGRMLCGHTAEGVATVDLDGGNLRYYRTGVGGGHPSISPDGRWIISDCYGDVGHLFLVNVESGECRDLLSVNRTADRLPEWWRDQDVPAKSKGPGVNCLHPNWSLDGTKVTFNAMFGAHSQVCMIDLSSIVGA